MIILFHQCALHLQLTKRTHMAADAVCDDAMSDVNALQVFVAEERQTAGRGCGGWYQSASR